MQFLEFSDHAIPYDTFLKDVASSVVKMLKEENDDPSLSATERLALCLAAVM